MILLHALWYYGGDICSHYKLDPSEDPFAVSQLTTSLSEPREVLVPATLSTIQVLEAVCVAGVFAPSCIIAHQH